LQQKWELQLSARQKQLTEKQFPAHIKEEGSSQALQTSLGSTLVRIHNKRFRFYFTVRSMLHRA